MSQNRYYQLNLFALPRELEEEISVQLFSWGAQGVQENLEFKQLDRHYQAQVVSSDQLNLVAYFDHKPCLETIQAYLRSYSGSQLELLEQENKDWLSEWKQHWQPFELCPQVWVVPSWLQADFRAPEHTQVLQVDPGMAFGTGTHETTQLAATLMQQLFSQQKIRSCLDVGTGSGILTLLAALHEVPELYAFDNDPECERVFFENSSKNGVQTARWVPQWAKEVRAELTVANIIDGVLLDLKEDFRELKSAYYIFTGVLAEREEAFVQEMTTGWPLELQTRLQKNDWVGFLFRGPQ